MKIFITGATGFIGSHVLKRALEDGLEVVALRVPGTRPFLAVQNEPHWVETRMDSVEAADFSNSDVVIHLASVGVSPQVATWEDMFYWNVAVQLRLLQKAHAAKIKRVVIAGSFAEYGRSSDRYDPIPPDAPLLPASGYAASKAAGFIAASAYALEVGLELFYLRIFSAYGEGQFAGNFWPSLRRAALEGVDFPMTPGEQVRDYIPVELVAAEFLHYATKAEAGSDQQTVLNVGTGCPVSMREFAETWWTKWGATGKLLLGALPYRTNEPMRFVPLISDEQRERMASLSAGFGT